MPTLTTMEKIADNFSTLQESDKLTALESTSEDKSLPMDDLKELSPFYGYNYIENQ